MPLEPTNKRIVVSPKVRVAIERLYKQLREDYAFLDNEPDTFVGTFQEMLARLEKLESAVAALVAERS